jgi:hypothetical protein
MGSPFLELAKHPVESFILSHRRKCLPKLKPKYVCGLDIQYFILNICKITPKLPNITIKVLLKLFDAKLEDVNFSYGIIALMPIKANIIIMYISIRFIKSRSFF